VIVRPLALVSLAALALACATARPPSPPAQAAAEAAPARPDPSALVAEGEAALRANAFPRADELFGRAAQAAPGEARPLALRSLAVFHQARFPEALSLARSSLALGETYEARLVTGRVSAIRRSLDDALRAYERCVALRPESAEAWSALAAARLAVGDEAGAARAWEGLVGTEARGKAEDRLWTDVLRLQPDPVQVQEALDRCARGTAARMAGHDAEAVHEFRAVVGSVPGYAHCWSELGKSWARLGRTSETEQAFRTALAGYRADQGGLRADTQALLAAHLLASGRDPAEALALARSARAVRGDRPDVAATLASACARTPGCSDAPGAPVAQGR
jgi:tetratricopeptide (TPR) repeat protein